MHFTVEPGRLQLMSNSNEISEEEINAQFRKIADAFIDLANDKSNDFNRENVSLAMLYAAARFNAYIVTAHAANVEDFDRDRQAAFDFFIDEYRRMLEENLNQYREVFGQLKYAHLMPDRPN